MEKLVVNYRVNIKYDVLDELTSVMRGYGSCEFEETKFPSVIHGQYDIESVEDFQGFSDLISELESLSSYIALEASIEVDSYEVVKEETL